MNLEINMKLSVVEDNARAFGKREVGIVRDQLARANDEYLARCAEIERRFDLDCWNGFEREFSADEICEMVTTINRKMTKV